MAGARHSADTLIPLAASIVGADAVRPARPGDTPGWEWPVIVVEPPDAQAVGETLAWAARDRIGVVPRGGGSKLAWGLPVTAPVILSLARLNRLVEHREGDLTMTAEAGMRLDDVNAALEAARQRLPLDPPHRDRATLGGIVATNDSGPLRHAWGTPRDLLIGASFVRADGARAKAGGIVVKNVAGYDIARLLAGSFGTLAVLTSVSFKLAPVPPDSATVIVWPPDLNALARVIDLLRRGPWSPEAVEIDGPEWRLLVRFASVPEAVAGQANALVPAAAAEGCVTEIARDQEQAGAWARREREIWSGATVVVRISVRPADLAPTLVAAYADAQADGVACRATGRALEGVLLLRLDGPPASVAGIIAASRERLRGTPGHIAISRGRAALASLAARATVSEPPGAAAVMRAIKRQFDPLGILSPGRAPEDL